MNAVIWQGNAKYTREQLYDRASRSIGVVQVGRANIPGIEILKHFDPVEYERQMARVQEYTGAQKWECSLCHKAHSDKFKAYDCCTDGEV